MENPRYKNYVCYDCQIESPPVNEKNIRLSFIILIQVVDLCQK